MGEKTMRIRLVDKQKYLGLAVFTLLILLFLKSDIPYSRQINAEFKAYSQNWRNFTSEDISKLSNLGRILYLDEPPPPANTGRKYQILIWKYGNKLENRHMKRYSGKRVDPFEHCSVRNCEITYKDSALETADIVIVHLHLTKGLSDLPQVRRNPDQIWAFLTDESPHHTFLNKNLNLSSFDGVFNWSMTYRMDSDIPVPYGRTMLRKTPFQDDLVPLNKRRDVLVAIMGSNCGGKNKRWEYVRELKKHIDIDVYGHCGTHKCAGHFRTDCHKLDNYLFYLAFENSNCDEYVTEKLWWNAYHKNAIPIVMGANAFNYSRLLPPNSYLNAEEYARPSDLAKFIMYLNATEVYRDYFTWRKQYEIVQEHAYFQSESFHYCRVCQALNYNERRTKVYKDLGRFWSVGRNCRPAWNEVGNDGRKN